MSYRAPVSDIAFALKHGAGFSAALADGIYGDLTEDVADAVLEEAGKFATEVIAPLNTVGDRQGAAFKDGNVTTPPGWKEAYRDWATAGWNGLAAPEAWGGQELPQALNAACLEMWNSAAMAFGLAPLLTMGTVDALTAHGSDELKRAYLPKLVAGEWTGTMQLTEPQAGSDVGALRTRAERAPDGSYRITGQKIFITYGEHDMADNIVHLVLARLPDAPSGTRGISLFLVPKFLLNADGSPGQRNDLRAHSIEHKMGIRGSPTCTMVLGDHGGATGYLIGEENRGMACMFTMMNQARLSVALQGIGVAERAYQQALAYARERKQGRAAGTKEGMSPIIAHPDVKRMLLTMRALTIAARTIAYATAVATDRAQRSADAAARATAARTRLALNADRKGVRHRCRLRGRLARRAGAWRHGLYRGDRRRPAHARCADRRDLRGHQRHPGHRSRDPQAAAVRWRRGETLYRRAAAHRRGGQGRQRPGLRRRPARALPKPSTHSNARRSGCCARRRATPRSPAPRPICGCSAMRRAARSLPSRRWRRCACRMTARHRHASRWRGSLRRTLRSVGTGLSGR